MANDQAFFINCINLIWWIFDGSMEDSAIWEASSGAVRNRRLSKVFWSSLFDSLSSLSSGCLFRNSHPFPFLSPHFFRVIAVYSQFSFKNSEDSLISCIEIRKSLRRTPLTAPLPSPLSMGVEEDFFQLGCMIASFTHLNMLRSNVAVICGSSLKCSHVKVTLRNYRLRVLLMT